MEHRTLGSSGTSVSTLTLGTMTFGDETDEAGAHAQLDRFVEAGGTLVDTADVYTAGVSEEIIGRWYASRPADVTDQVVLASKGRFPMGDGPNDVGLSRRHLSRALDASLRRLGVETIDLYQVHAYDPWTPLEETFAFLADAQRAGKIHYAGLSNFTGWQLQRVCDLAEFRGTARPVTLQPQYNLLVREIEWEVVPAAQANGLGLLPWSPLGGGWLTGKYQRDTPPTGATRLGEDPTRGVEAYDRRSVVERTWDVVEAVREVAEGRGASMAQVALSWLVDRPTVTSVILGARTVEQLDDNLGAAGLHLSAEETAPPRRRQRPGGGRLPVRRAGHRAAQPAHRGRPVTAPEPVDLARVLAGVPEPWSPRTVAVLNGDYDVRVARTQGEFPRHAHPETDEFFLVLSGTLLLRTDQGDVELGPGQAHVVPRGVAHQPVSVDGAQILLIEPSETVNTGDTPGALTAERRLA